MPSPLVQGIEAIAAGHRAAGLSKRAEYQAWLAIYCEWDRELQAKLHQLRADMRIVSEAERVAWADAKSAESCERMGRRTA